MTVRIAGRNPCEAVGFVTLPGATTEVRVRVRWDGPHAWRCDACGRFASPACMHCQAVYTEMEVTQ